MAIHDWHFGKIVLTWVLTLGAWPIFNELFYRADAVIFWAIVAGIAAVITWRWFSGQEGSPERMTSYSPPQVQQSHTSGEGLPRRAQGSPASAPANSADNKESAYFGPVVTALMKEYDIAEEEIQRKYISYSLALRASGATSKWNEDVDGHGRAIGALTGGEISAAKTDFHQAVLNRIIIALVTDGCRRLDFEDDEPVEKFPQTRMEQVDVEAYPLPPEIMDAALQAWMRAAGRRFRSQDELEQAQEALFAKWILMLRGIERDNFLEESAEDLGQQAEWQYPPMEEDAKRGEVAGVLELQRLALARARNGEAWELLLARAKQDLESADITALRLAYSESSDHSPYAVQIESLLKAEAVLTNGDYRAAILDLNSILERDPLNPKANALVADALQSAERATGHATTDEWHRRFASCLAQSVMSSGTGDSFASAFEVISLTEEHSALDLLGVEAMGPPRVVEHASHVYDVFRTVNRLTGERQEVFFLVDRIHGKTSGLADETLDPSTPQYGIQLLARIQQAKTAGEHAAADRLIDEFVSHVRQVAGIHFAREQAERFIKLAESMRSTS